MATPEKRSSLVHDPLAPELRENARKLAARWWLFLVLGVAAVVVGTLLVLDVFTAVRVLALWAALSLFISGVMDLVAVDRFRPRWLGLVSGGLFVAAGVIAVAWPGITLSAIALVVGIGLLLGGAFRTTGAWSDRTSKGWWLTLLGGVASLVAGVAALVWPALTILALAVLLGVRTLVLGAVEISFAFALKSLQREFV